MILKWIILSAFFMFSLIGNTTSQEQQFCEYIGHFFWSEFNQEDPLDVEPVIKGMREASKGKPPEMKEEQFSQYIQIREKKFYERIAQKNLLEAENFLRNIKSSTQEVIRDKLYVKIERPGNGSSINEEGDFEFKGNYLGEEPFVNNSQVYSQSLNHAILGIKEGVKGMKEGEVRILYIHPDLAYGKFNPRHAHKLLIVEAHLIKIK